MLAVERAEQGRGRSVTTLRWPHAASLCCSCVRASSPCVPLPPPPPRQESLTAVRRLAEINLKNRFQCWDVISHQDGIPKDRTFMSITARRIKTYQSSMDTSGAVLNWVPYYSVCAPKCVSLLVLWILIWFFCEANVAPRIQEFLLPSLAGHMMTGKLPNKSWLLYTVLKSKQT
ncbi:hypothetical protein MJT46_004279 [Ovis ammon polii x Ovis aries]|nr:hypothetical protein MJT46_004279 [Ovis ammon polii x Ovis aries]